jgi:hypothetical protein
VRFAKPQSRRDTKAWLDFYAGNDIEPAKPRVKRLDPELPTEEEEQIKYFVWVSRCRINNEPLAPHVYHVPNGGARTEWAGAALKRQGVRAGVPDINVDIPASPYHGLRIEMKRLGGTASANQITQLRHLNAMGYHAVVCQGFDAARRVTVDYLSACYQLTDPYR